MANVGTENPMRLGIHTYKLLADPGLCSFRGRPRHGLGLEQDILS